MSNNEVFEYNKKGYPKCSKENLNKMKLTIKEQRKILGEEIDVCDKCSIPIESGAILKCGHNMCMDCYIDNSRLGNKCLVCSDIYADPLKEDGHINSEQIEEMIETLFANANGTPENYFLDATMKIKMRGYKESKQTLHWYMIENARIIGKKVLHWYKEN